MLRREWRRHETKRKKFSFCLILHFCLLLSVSLELIKFYELKNEIQMILLIFHLCILIKVAARCAVKGVEECSDYVNDPFGGDSLIWAPEATQPTDSPIHYRFFHARAFFISNFNICFVKKKRSSSRELFPSCALPIWVSAVMNSYSDIFLRN